jgi:hypothetical protein
MNPLTSVKGSLITGFVLAILFAVLAVDGGWNELGLARWLHIIAGITWIGLLYYFNAVQVPALADAAADKGGPGGAGITKYVAPRALLWFRWSAVATWLTGVWYLARAGALGAFALRSLFPEQLEGLANVNRRQIVAARIEKGQGARQQRLDVVLGYVRHGPSSAGRVLTCNRKRPVVQKLRHRPTAAKPGEGQG